MADSNGGEVDELVGIDLDVLDTYLAEHVDLAGPLSGSLIHGGRSNLTYRLTDGRSTWVLRRPPLGNVLPSAHDMGREYRVIEALHPTDVPVPEPIVLCRDEAVLGATFYVMEHVEGPVLRSADDTRDLPPSQAEHYGKELVDALVRMHSVDLDRLEGFGRPEGFMARQVARWAKQWSLSATRELPALDELVGRLSAAVPAPQAAGLVHGDFRLDNVIFAPGERGSVAAIIDWEMSTLGDPLADLGLMVVYWDPVTEAVVGSKHAVSANPGFPTASALTEAYAGATGYDLSDLDFYVAFGYFKLAVIAEGIHARFLAGRTVGHGFETVGGVVPELVNRGLASLRPRS